MAIDSMSAPTIIRVFLWFSKCDQVRKGANVFIGRMNDKLCPVAAAIAYMAVRGSCPGPFFCDIRGTPLLKVRFVAKLKEVLTAMRVDQSQYAGHSFRIGAALGQALKRAPFVCWGDGTATRSCSTSVSQACPWQNLQVPCLLWRCETSYSFGRGRVPVHTLHPSIPSRGAGLP